MTEELKYFSLAHELNEKFKTLLVKNKVHFRPSLNSLSLISISEEKPELGIKCSFTKYNSANNIQELIEADTEKINIKTEPQRPTPEKYLQALIISYALNNNYELPFDKNIKFISSEIAIKNNAGKKIVTDILGYNETTNKLCVIELKYDRQEKRLIEQVNNFENVINEKPEFFSQLLSIHGFKNTSRIPLTTAKLVVWPHEKTSPKIKLKTENIVEITFHPDYSFQNFN
jgi:hypothetical protein